MATMVTKRPPGRKKKARQSSVQVRAGSPRRLAEAPARKGGMGLLAVLGALILLNLYVFVWNKDTAVATMKAKAEKATPALALPHLEAAEPHKHELSTPPVAAPGTTADVQKGDSLGKVLKRAGLAGAQADEVIRAMSSVLDLTTIKPGQTLTIFRDAQGEVERVEYRVNKTQTIKVERNAQGQLEGVGLKAQTRMVPATVGGDIRSSLYAAVKDAGEDPSLVAFFVDVFAYDLDFYNDTHEGDSFRVVVEKEMLGDTFIGYGNILAAQYDGKAGHFEAFRHGTGAQAHYFDAQGQALERQFLKTPLKFARVSSGFNRKRLHPVLHRVKAHLGVDYAAPTDTPVWASAAGTVVHRGPAGGAGNLVTIRHDNGLETLYMHLSRFAPSVRLGQRVEAKTVVGFVGATGLATGPHLHFGVKQHGVFIDPSKLAPTRRAPIPAGQRAAYRDQVAALSAQLQQARLDQGNFLASLGLWATKLLASS